jgi:hypothetical protein
MPGPHPSNKDLTAFAVGALDRAAMARVEAHLAVCSTCCDVLKTLPGDAFVNLLRSCRSPPRGEENGSP